MEQDVSWGIRMCINVGSVLGGMRDRVEKMQRQEPARRKLEKLRRAEGGCGHKKDGRETVQTQSKRVGQKTVTK
jgi:hypothetical protein